MMMRTLRFAIGLLLAAVGCAEARAAPNADVRSELSRTHEQLGGAMALFAATVVEGGGVKGDNKKPPQAVVEVTHEFAGQHIAPGRVKLGRQNATFRIIAASKFEEERDFEIPLNGTRIFAFGDPSGAALVVYANHMFAASDANHANATRGRGPAAGAAYQGPLFFASLGIAFAAIFLAWFRVKLGAIALAAAVAFWIAYEATIPTQTNIRIELLLLLPVLVAAGISVAAAALYGRKK